MSFPQMVDTICPHCGSQIHITKWYSLNVDLTPNLFEALVWEDLFNMRCSACGHEFTQLYPMIVHDMSHKALIFLAPDAEDLATAKKHLDMIHKSGLPDYNYRIVRNEHELIEKAQILHADLDDRIIELIKAMYTRQYVRDFNNIPETYFQINPNNPQDKGFVFFGTPERSRDLSDEAYERAVIDFQHFCDNTYEECLTVDKNWVNRVLEKKYGAS